MTSNISLLTEEMFDIVISGGASFHILIDGKPDIHNKNTATFLQCFYFVVLKSQIPEKIGEIIREIEKWMEILEIR